MILVKDISVKPIIFSTKYHLLGRKRELGNLTMLSSCTDNSSSYERISVKGGQDVKLVPSEFLLEMNFLLFAILLFLPAILDQSG